MVRLCSRRHELGYFAGRMWGNPLEYVRCLSLGTLSLAAIPAVGAIASDVRFEKRVLGSLAIHCALLPVFPQAEKARCLLEKDTKS